MEDGGVESRATMAGKAGKIWSLPRFWVSLRSCKKQNFQKKLDRILDLAWLKFAVAALVDRICNLCNFTDNECVNVSL